MALADKGLETSNKFKSVFSALIADVAAERIAVNRANAMSNAGGKLLKVVEMEHKYGGKPKGQRNCLQLLD